MTRDEIDTLWNQMLHLPDEQFTRYRFAELVAAAEREEIKQLRAERNTAQASLASIQIGWENWRVTHSTAFKDTEIQRLREEIEAEREACATARVAIGHLKAVLAECVYDHVRADTEARDWLVSIGDDVEEKK